MGKCRVLTIEPPPPPPRMEGPDALVTNGPH
jgi:hypothetical protein